MKGENPGTLRERESYSLLNGEKIKNQRKEKGKRSLLEEYIKNDLYRYYGEERISILKKVKSQLHPARKYMILFRKVQFCKNKFIKKILKYRLRLLSYKTQIQILPDTEIGEGFYIEHFGRIIINKKSKIGKNVNIATGVVIGESFRGKRKRKS